MRLLAYRPKLRQHYLQGPWNVDIEKKKKKLCVSYIQMNTYENELDISPYCPAISVQFHCRLFESQFRTSYNLIVLWSISIVAVDAREMG